MTDNALTDEAARALRRAWFDFLDVVEPLRADLHRYCLRLTGEIWSAEDLCQDTLLRGFGAIGRGDLHGEPARMKSPRAYLFRTATNLWIDQLRHARHEASAEPDPPGAPPDAETLVQVREAGELLFAAGAPQERAALVLKDAFDFSLEEIAELLSTTPGAVKSALRRARGKLTETPLSMICAAPPSKALIDRFAAAFNARDVIALRDTLLENASIEVHGVGGGRGRGGEWATHSIEFATPQTEARLFHGEWIALHLTANGRLAGVTRIEEQAGAVSRVRSYGYAPDTTAAVAAELGLEYRRGRYHQGADALPSMIATTTLPWLASEETRP